MTKKDVIDLNLIFQSLKDVGNTKFKYTILKNIEVLKQELSVLKETEKQIEDTISDFTKERNDLILKLGTKDNNGGVRINVEDKETMNTFTEEVKVLVTKHQDKINDYNSKILEFNTILEEQLENDLPFRKISIDNCPDVGISTDQLNKLLEFKIIND